VLLIGALVPEPVCGATLDEAWSLGARLLFNDAARAFDEIAREGGERRREADFGRAVMLLNVQPKTNGNVEESRTLFTRVRAENEEDDFGIASLYYLARLAHYHGRVADAKTARRYYQELSERHPEHTYGQLARLKLVTLILYGADTAGSGADRLSAAEALGTLLKDPSMRSDFHLAMADAWLRFENNEQRALDHLVAAEETGHLVRDSVRASVYVQAGELARRLGHREQAISYYRRFLADFPRDTRAWTIRGRLTNLEGELGT
jgi:tetratricopeptide (TPR) repeat protein